MKATWIVAVLAGAVLLGGSRASAEVQYTITDLGTPGEERSWPYDLNNAGQVLGLVWPAGAGGLGSELFLWDPVAGMRELAPLLGQGADASGINDSGQLVYSAPDSGGYGAYLWDLAGQPEYLGAFFPWAVNNAGQVVGRALGPGTRTVVWDRAAGLRDVGVLPGGTWAEARVINGAGQVAGSANTGIPATGHPKQHSLRTVNVQHHAFLWDPGSGMRDLGTLGGDFAWATGMNDSGQVVGLSYTGNGAEYRAFLWDASGGMVDLGILPGHEDSEAHAINGAGQVVGLSGVYNGDQGGFIWDSVNGMRAIEDLLPDGLGWTYFEPVDINDAGQILGRRVIVTWGYDDSGTYRQFQNERVILLTPIPEPATCCLLVCGIVALTYRRAKPHIEKHM